MCAPLLSWGEYLPKGENTLQLSSWASQNDHFQGTRSPQFFAHERIPNPLQCDYGGGPHILKGEDFPPSNGGLVEVLPRAKNLWTPLWPRDTSPALKNSGVKRGVRKILSPYLLPPPNDPQCWCKSPLTGGEATLKKRGPIPQKGFRTHQWEVKTP